MTECDTADVVLLPFPFSDYTSYKQRPALIVSSSAWNSSRDDIIVVVISSKTARGKYEYALSEREQRSGGLRVPSVVRLGNIYTVDKRLVRERIGSFEKSTMQFIQSGIHKIISL
ncbi:MAG: type II toxin-antitoxin system PemK/MazF family toxin [bacterium]|nr:type II toxin-antitoxin system PemK/MazF family toxin [bacterium]